MGQALLLHEVAAHPDQTARSAAARVVGRFSSGVHVFRDRMCLRLSPKQPAAARVTPRATRARRGGRAAVVGNPVLTAFVARFLLKHSKETSCLRRTKAGRVQNGTREELAWYYEKVGCVQEGVFFISLEFRDAPGDLQVPFFPEPRHPIWTWVICAYSART